LFSGESRLGYVAGNVFDDVQQRPRGSYFQREVSAMLMLDQMRRPDGPRNGLNEQLAVSNRRKRPSAGIWPKP
jgi:hypothetical protein